MRSLHEEVADGKVAEVQRLLSEGAEVNARGDLGMTPLHRALYESGRARSNPKHFADAMQIIQLLLDHGADVATKDDLGHDALQWARMANNEEAARLIEQRLGLRTGSTPGSPQSGAATATPIVFPCSSCQTRLRVRAELAGKRVKCPRCANVTPIPPAAPTVVPPPSLPEHKEPAPETRTETPASAKANEVMNQALKDLLQKIKSGQPAQIAFSALRGNFDNRVRFMEAWAGTGKMPAVALIVLQSHSPRGSKERLLLRTGRREEFVKFYNEAGRDDLLRQLMPGKTWDNLQGESLSNCELPGLKLTSLEPFNRLFQEIEEGSYCVRSVITARRTMRRLEFRETCDWCADDVLTIHELILLARGAGMDVVDDRVVAPAALKKWVPDLENRKGFKCETCQFVDGRISSQIICQECLLAAAPYSGPLAQTCPDCGKVIAPSVGGRCHGSGLHCPDCGRAVHRLQDYYEKLGTYFEYSDPTQRYDQKEGLERQTRIAEIADHFFDLSTESCKYPVLFATSLSDRLQQSADGTITGGGWKEVNAALRHNKESKQEAILLCVTKERASGCLSRALRERLRAAQIPFSAAEIRPVLLGVALRRAYNVVGSGNDYSSSGMEITDLGVSECVRPIVRSGHLLRILALRAMIKQFGSSWKPTGALRNLILRESADLAQVLLKNHAKVYDFNLVHGLE